MYNGVDSALLNWMGNAYFGMSETQFLFLLAVCIARLVQRKVGGHVGQKVRTRKFYVLLACRQKQFEEYF